MTSSPSPRLRSLSLGADFLRRLESLAIAAHKLIAQGGIASRAGAVRGGRAEFLEHRGYVEGDDLRDVDWNVYARTGEPFVKIFGAEREKQVCLVLDLSPSMAAVSGKDTAACRLTAALAHVALASGDTVRLRIAGNEDAPSPTLKGVQATREILRQLEQAPLTHAIDWNAECAALTSLLRTRGTVIILSDFWTEDAVAALTPLAKARQDVSLLQILTPDELRPPLGGNVRLEDSETGEEVSLSLSKSDLDAYRTAVENHIESLADTARRAQMRHLLCRTDIPFERLVLTYLRQGGLLR